MSIKRGTTPTHTFSIPVAEADIADCTAVYCQNGTVVLQIDKAACTFSDDGDTHTLSLTLTQDQTLLFIAGTAVEIEIIIKTTAGKCLRSGIISAVADRTLLGEVFT